MRCMKCGKRTENEQVFCESCLTIMAQFPVRQDIHIQLPNRTPPFQKKVPPKKKAPSTEEQIKGLRKTVKWLSLCLACTLLFLGLTVSFLVQLSYPEKPGDSIGQNYSTVDSDADTH